VAHDLGVPGQRRARGEVMELADEFGRPDQAGLGRYTRHAGFLPGHIAFHEAQDLPPLLVQAIPLLGAGFSDLLARLAPWLVLPRASGVPGWCFVGSRCSASTRWTG
jgi:hypothetical protein